MKITGVLSLSCLVATVVAHSGELTLAEDGKAVADVAIGVNPTKIAQFAAKELKFHLDEITGGDFKIVEDSAVEFGVELRTKEGSVAFRGEDRDQRGKIPEAWLPGLYDRQDSLYAVYDFLERECGVLWVDPTDFGTVLPKRATLKVSSEFKPKEPFIRYRGGAPIDHDNYEPLTWNRNSEGEKRYNELAYGGKNATEIKYRQRLFMRRKRLGGEFAPANHSFYFWYDRFWEKGKGKTADARFVGKRPDLFAKGYEGQPPQLCYLNPDTIKQVVDDIGRYFDDAEFRKLYFGGKFIWGENAFCLEPMDNRAFCKCERCSKLYEPGREGDKSQHSTYWFTFVNEVARQIKAKYPGKRISTLAYMSHEGLPKGVTLEDNVVVYFCISANRGRWSKGLQAQIDRMAEWRNAYPAQPLGMWLYNTFPLEFARNGGYHCFPGFFADVAEKEYRIFKELNVRAGIFHCGFNGNIDNYMQCAWMIDPDRKAAELLDEYFAGFGKAAVPLKKFYRLVEKRYCDASLYPEKSSGHTVELAWNILGTKEVMDKLGGYMVEAEKFAETPEEKARVELFKRDVWDYMKEGFDTYTERANAPVPHWTAVRVPSAGGDADKVDWSKVPADNTVLFERGGSGKTTIGECVRWAHDDTHLYLEITERTNPKKLNDAPQINPCDVWEFMLSFQKAQPFRYWVTGPKGRIAGLSYGEVNFRQAVPASESGHPSYSVVAKTDLSAADRWTGRWAFPMDQALDHPIKPGDTLYFNATRVMHNDVLDDAMPGHPHSHFLFGIFTLVSHTTVKTCDRAAEVRISE